MKGHLAPSLRVWALLAGCWMGALVPAAPAPVRPKEGAWQIANFAEDAGIARRMVFDVAFSADDSLWLATSEGLYRYDGYVWRKFTVADGLPSNFIRSVTVTQSGSLWVGTDRGAGTFDGTHYDSHGSEVGLAGPNVRRIVEDPDGSLWFCCDRWPDAATPGGLSTLQEGKWRSQGIADGLPFDHVFDYLRTSRGRQIAMTVHGPAERLGDRWTPLADPGYPERDQTWHMVEATDGTVFAEGQSNILVCSEGRWRVVPGAAFPLCRTREGEVVSLRRDPAGSSFFFTRWNGTEFIQASAGIPAGGIFWEVMRQAPDGAVWCVGPGTVLRWEYHEGEWTAFEGLPPPRFVDRKGQLWFADGERTVVQRGPGFETVPDVRLPMIQDGRGFVWGKIPGGVARVSLTDLAVDRFRADPLGIPGVSALWADAAGEPWLQGILPTGKAALVRFDGARWLRVAERELSSWQIHAVAPDPEEGLWLVLLPPEGNEFQVARADRHGLALVPFVEPKPNTHNPSIAADNRRLWLYGYNGLFQAARDEPGRWRPVSELPRAAFLGHFVGRDEIVFRYGEGPHGRGGAASFRGDRWAEYSLDLADAISGEADGTLLVADGRGFHWRRREADLQMDYVHLPVQATIASLLRDAAGNIWLETTDGILRHRPSQVCPETVIAEADHEVRQGGQLRPVARGVNRFVPRSRPDAFRFSWRFDAGPWSEFALLPAAGFPVAGLGTGRHRLELRARSAAGAADPTPAGLDFRVFPVPLQERRWFAPVVLAVFAGVLALSGYALVTRRRLAKYAHVLEDRVRQRTAELEQDNRERRRAETEVQRLNRELEQRVEDRTAQLAAANKELEAFSYSVSHDLRSPLRHIVGFVHLLQDQTGNLNAEGRRQLGVIADSAKRMGVLIDELLAFSRLGRTELHRVQVNTNELVAEVVRELAHETAGRNIDWQIRPLPDVRADATLLKQVFVNLLSNAIKYTRPRPRAEIEVRCRPPAESDVREWVFLVRDNGVGFNGKYADKLFGVFQRLHGAAEFEGHGIGLANVRRIVHRHRGRTWAEGEPDRGATFSFSLPIDPLPCPDGK